MAKLLKKIERQARSTQEGSRRDTRFKFFADYKDTRLHDHARFINKPDEYDYEGKTGKKKEAPLNFNENFYYAAFCIVTPAGSA